MIRLDELLEDLNNKVSDNLTYPKTKFWRQAELQTINEKTFPLVNNGNQKGYKLSPDDSFALQSYHRVIESKTDTDYSKGKGKYPYQTRTYTIRNVWLGSLKRMVTKPYETNDDVKNDVVEAFPAILLNKEIVMITNESVNKQEILNEEFDGFETKSLVLDLIVFYIEYEIKQKVKCN